MNTNAVRMKNLSLSTIFSIYIIIRCIIKCFYGLNCIIINPVKMKTPPNLPLSWHIASQRLRSRNTKFAECRCVSDSPVGVAEQ